MFEEENGQTNGLLIVVKREEEEEEEAVVVGFEEERMLVARQCLTQTMPFAAPEVCVCACACACACVSLSLFPPFFFSFLFLFNSTVLCFLFYLLLFGAAFCFLFVVPAHFPQRCMDFLSFSLSRGFVALYAYHFFFLFLDLFVVALFSSSYGEESLSLVISYHEERGVLFHICHPHSQ